MRVPIDQKCLCMFLPNPRPLKLVKSSELNVIILQHSHESREFKNTGGFIPACLKNAHLITGKKFAKGCNEKLKQACDDIEGTWVLYPSASALDIAELITKNLEETQHPLKGSLPLRNLIVIDGTWIYAKRLISRNHTLLKGMRYLCINPKHATRYRIRSEPNEKYLSTLEAVAFCISTIEDDQSIYDKMTLPLDGLVESFNSIVINNQTT
ncbi:hypothetical protein AKO1_015550 [Acrasis kona]|uniref:tRNA-uridine aminocarboxypropyltransferase n=1 Tax=Acrasis kona TaxID=1008807 RepID=A0AAW2ZIB2_9EUKA